MMEWNKLVSTKRFGLEDFHNDEEQDRTEFQRDFDRLIFSSPFRRLQNKTQVFPLPGSVFVHNRLTHSLEVSCVGRSLGNAVYKHLREKNGDSIDECVAEIGSIVSAACLAHDMGNPPFGHSGETAISSYFSEGNGQKLKAEYGINEKEWNDFIHFEGNANAFRLLTHQFGGRRKGGFVLTYSTIASVVKYPYESGLITAKKKKFGFFQSEKADYEKIANDLGIIRKSDGCYVRHPLVFLVEAADDICYEIMDIEDAHKLKLLSNADVQSLFLSFFDEEGQLHKSRHLNNLSDENERIAYLRSSVIGILVRQCAEVFIKNIDSIMNGEFSQSLIDCVGGRVGDTYERCKKLSFEKIYKSKDVVDIEIAGYNIIYTLIDKIINAVFSQDKAYSKQLLARIPEQYQISDPDPYCRILAVLDYVSGMTDVYALDLYRKITGMSLPSL